MSAIDPTGAEIRRSMLLYRVAVWFNEHAYPPTLRELVGPDTYASTSNVWENLVLLERAGYVTVDRRTHRGIRLTEKGERVTDGAA